MNFVKIFISAAVAFLMSIAVAMAIESFGGAIGSFIGTIPSTIIPAVYIILTENGSSEEMKISATLGALYGMFATDILFLPSWKVIPPRLPKKWSNPAKVWVSAILSLLIWFVGALVVVLLQSFLVGLGLSPWIFGIGLIVFTAACGIVLCWRLPPTPPGKNKVKWYIHLSRGVAAAIAIFASGVLSQSGAGVAAGAMSTFPAIFCTTMVSVSLAQGTEVTTGAVGPLLMGAMSVGTFTMISAGIYKLLHWHAAWCCVIALIVSIVCWCIPVFFFIRWRRNKTIEMTAKVVDEASRENDGIEMKKMESEIEEEKPTPPTSNDVESAKSIAISPEIEP